MAITTQTFPVPDKRFQYLKKIQEQREPILKKAKGRSNMKLRVTSLLILISVAQVSLGQERVPKEVYFQKLKDLRNQINILSDAPEGRFRSTINLCKEIVTRAVGNEAIFGGDFSIKHINSIDYLIKFSNEIRAAETENKESMASLLLKDLTLKFVDDSNAAANIDKIIVNNKLIVVIILTMRDNVEANNLRVKWSSIGFHINFNEPNGSFGKLTSPAIDEMVPGFYTFWVTKDGDSVVLNKKEHEVDPKKTNSIEFTIH